MGIYSITVPSWEAKSNMCCEDLEGGTRLNLARGRLSSLYQASAYSEGGDAGDCEGAMPANEYTRPSYSTDE
jgi:hypothetical protein